MCTCISIHSRTTVLEFGSGREELPPMLEGEGNIYIGVNCVEDDWSGHGQGGSELEPYGTCRVYMFTVEAAWPELSRTLEVELKNRCEVFDDEDDQYDDSRQPGTRTTSRSTSSRRPRAVALALSVVVRSRRLKL